MDNLENLIIAIILGPSPESGYRYNLGGEISIGEKEKAKITDFYFEKNRVYLIVEHNGNRFYNRSFPESMCQFVYDSKP